MLPSILNGLQNHLIKSTAQGLTLSTPAYWVKITLLLVGFVLATDDQRQLQHKYETAVLTD